MELLFSHFDYNENLSQQRDLFKDCFPETNGEAIQQKAHYQWKFHSFPGTCQSWEYASYIGQEMVGYYAAIPYQYKIGEKITPVGMVCDVMTSSKQRGKGIFTKMGTYATNELSSCVPFTMGYPIRKAVIPGHIKVGWKIPFSLPLYMKFIRLNSFLKTKKVGFLAPIANSCLFLINSIVKTKLNSNYKITPFTNISDIVGYDDFATEWSNSIPNSLIKNLQFAKWRYGAPCRAYKFLSITNIVGKMIGFVSYRSIVKEGVPAYGILDYMVLPEYSDCHRSINQFLTNSARKDKTEAIMTMMSKKSAAEYKLCQNGFFKSPFVFHLIIKNLTKAYSDEELFNESNWHLMWVDSDDL